MMDDMTYTPYVITVNIPNVICEKCSLHLSNPMTDKIGEDGSPLGIGCTDPGTCFSVYHSCTRPFKIAGSVEDGAVPRSEYVCETKNEGWPQVWLGDYGESVDASTPFLYRRSSAWNEVNHTLTTVPIQFTEDAGGVCGASVESGSEVELSSIGSDIANANTDDNSAEENPNTEQIDGLDGASVDRLPQPHSASAANNAKVSFLLSWKAVSVGILVYLSFIGFA